MASLLDFLSPSVISSTVTCTGTCLALSHSGSVIPKQFAKTKAMSGNPSIGYDANAKHYNYLFASHGASSSQKWTHVINNAVSHLEDELTELRDGLSAMKTDLQREMSRSGGLDSKYALLVDHIDHVEQLASDKAVSRVTDGLRELRDGLDRLEHDLGGQNSRYDELSSDMASLTEEIRSIALLASKYSEVTQLAEDVDKVKGFMSSAKEELSTSVKMQIKEFQEAVQDISQSRDDASKVINDLGEDFRQQIIAAEEDVLSARNDMSELVDQFSQKFQDELGDVRKKLSEEIATAVKGTQDETQQRFQELRQDLDDLYNNLEESRHTAKSDLSGAKNEISESLARSSNELREEIESTNKDLYDTQAELKKLQHELDDCNSTIDGSHNAIREGLFAARNEMATSLEKYNEEIREEIRATKEALAIAQDEKSEYLDECITDLQAGNRTARKELIETEMKLESLQRQVDETRDEAKNSHSTLEAHAQDTFSTLESKLEKMEGGLSEAKTSIDENRKQMLETLSTTRRSLDESMAEYNEDLKNDNNMIRKELEDAKLELQGIREKLDNARTEVESSHKTSQGHSRNISLLRTEVGHIEKALKNLKDNIAASRKAAEDALNVARKETADAAAKTSEELRQNNETTKKALHDAQLELKDLRTALDALSAARQETSESVAKSNEDLRKENEAMKKSLADAQAELNGLRKELAAVRADSKEATEAANFYAKDLSATKIELDQLRKDLTREREDRQNELVVPSMDFNSHAEELSALKAELQELKQELDHDREGKQNKLVVSREDFDGLAKDFHDMAIRISQVEPLQEEVHFLRRRLRDWDLGSVASVADSELASTYSYEIGYGDVPGTPQTGEHRRSLSIRSGRSTENSVRAPAKRIASSDLRSALLPNQELTKDGKIKKRPAKRDPKRSASHVV